MPKPAGRLLYDHYAMEAMDILRQSEVKEENPGCALARDNFSFFCEFLTRDQPETHQLKPMQHHLVWHEALVTNKNSKCLLKVAGPRRTSILSPRGSAKSTTLGLFAAWCIGIHAEAGMPLQILYISYNKDMARDKSGAIKLIIESEEYQEIFPSVRPGNKWCDEHWSIDRKHAKIRTLGQEEFTMIAAGITGGIASKRSHLILFDDLVKSYDDINNPDIRERMIRTWRSTIRPVLFEGGRFISVNTRWRPDDIFNTEFIPEKGWKVIEQSALNYNDETGQEVSYWEEMWSTDYLKEMREADPFSFTFQYQNKVERIQGLAFESEWIQYGIPPHDFDSLAIGVDLASSEKERACFTVMVLIGKKAGRYYFLDYRRGKWIGNLEKISHLTDLYEDWYKVDTKFRVYAESIAYQSSLISDFTQILHVEQNRQDIRCIPVTLKGDKLSHMISITGIFANGMVEFNQFVNWGDFTNELINFGSTPFCDCVDASAIALKGLGAYKPLSTPGMKHFHDDPNRDNELETIYED